MHSILVVFVILLSILLLISALGGSLNIQEKFEDKERTVAEMFYETSPEEEQLQTEMPPEVPTEVPTQVSSGGPTPSTEEGFSNGVEPFEDEDAKYGAPL